MTFHEYLEKSANRPLYRGDDYLDRYTNFWINIHPKNVNEVRAHLWIIHCDKETVKMAVVWFKRYREFLRNRSRTCQHAMMEPVWQNLRWETECRDCGEPFYSQWRKVK